METIEDIVREMRGIKDWRGDDVPIFTDWADRIEAAANEIITELNVATAFYRVAIKERDAERSTVDALRVEIARLRAALESVMAECQYRTCRRTCGFLDKDDRTYDCSLKNCPFAEERK